VGMISYITISHYFLESYFKVSKPDSID